MAEGGLVNSATCLTEPTVSVRVKHLPLNHYVLIFQKCAPLVKVTEEWDKTVKDF